ncbi:MAG: hypothetical protein WBA10_20400, partial [Elainellaceae cyanobacterium]
DRLLPFVTSPDWMLRKRLAEALGNLPDARSERALNVLKIDNTALVADAAARSLQQLHELP